MAKPIFLLALLLFILSAHWLSDLCKQNLCLRAENVERWNHQFKCAFQIVWKHKSIIRRFLQGENAKGLRSKHRSTSLPCLVQTMWVTFHQQTWFYLPSFMRQLIIPPRSAQSGAREHICNLTYLLSWSCSPFLSEDSPPLGLEDIRN